MAMPAAMLSRPMLCPMSYVMSERNVVFLAGMT